MLESETRRLARCHNIADLRALAEKRLPRKIFAYLDGGADDEVSMRANERAFDRYSLVTRTLVDVGEIDISTTVLGRKIDWPVMLAPTGMSRLFHHDGECAVARAAARSGTLYTLSTVSTVSIEEVGAAADGPKSFQIYMFRDRGLVTEFIERARGAGYTSLCLTVDVPVAGNRERDLRAGLSGPRTMLDGLAHPPWLWRYLTGEPLMLANVAHKVPGGRDLATLADYVSAQFDPGVTWDDAAWIIEQWDGPFAIKGILSAQDAMRAASIGATAVIVSNHGGRQLDGVAAPIDVVGEIADAVGDQVEIILDSGVRRGTHVLKALAMGARACMIGRPYLYGLGAGGETGVDRALALLRAEIERDMAIMGCRSLGELDSRSIRRQARHDLDPTI
ncbi:MAG: alpha-hydroxy acid oxidase [Sphingomonadales bacterium]